MSNPSFSPTFQALLKEVQFTRDILGAGATQIRRANYASKGTYFLALVSLSTGLERLGKLCLMMDHLLLHGSFPDLAQLKREIGHRLSLIHERTQALVQRRGLTLQFRQTLDDPIHSAILGCLHNFAEGDRYANINLLAGAPSATDPVAAWHQEVDLPLFRLRVSPAKQARIRRNAQMIDQLIGPMSMVVHLSETGDAIDNLEDASFRTGAMEAVGPYRQLYVLQIIRYWVEVLGELQYPAMQVSDDIPHFSEVLAIFNNDDSYFRSRKTWEKL
jgi:hypothetical protein